MENVTNERKQPVLKALAIAGLLGTIIFTAWLAIQIVQLLPKAASSLASLADSVYNYNPTAEPSLEMASSQTMVNVAEPFSISWKDSQVPGIYTFIYSCQEGINLDISTKDKNFPDADCNKAYELGTDKSLTLTIKSEKDRFAEVLYTISFYRTNATIATASYNGKVTVVNPNLFAQAETATTTTEIIEENVPVTTEPVNPPVEEVKPEPEVVVVPVTPKPKPEIIETKPEVITVPEYIYEIPQSQKDGLTDLAVSYLGIGIIDNDGTFIKTDSITINKPGALQFAVHNIGNKTSEDWTFTTILPGKVNYTSNSQEPLLPNERAVLTIEFPAIKDSYLQNFSVKVDTSKDKNNGNNEFSASSVVLR